jgi:hypothetical protein
MTARYGHNDHTRITGTSATNCKAGPGILRRITVNTSAAGTITVRDALTDTTPIIAVITCVASVGPTVVEFDVPFAVGLRVTASAVMDITVVYA